MSDGAGANTPGQPRSPEDAAALAGFDQRFALPLVLSALLPIVLSPGSTRSILAAIVNIVAWGVFIVDFVVHERRLQHYLSTWLGRFDLTVVVLTAPWFLVFDAGDAKFVLVIRLARIARLVMATKGRAETLRTPRPRGPRRRARRRMRSRRRIPRWNTPPTPASRPTATRSGGGSSP